MKWHKSGDLVGRWTLLGTERRNIGKQPVTFWRCRCSCGTERAVRSCHLTSGKSRSCGCLHKEICSITSTTHGDSRSRLHMVWCSMKQRCTNPRNRAFKNYGARGIHIHPKWMTYEGFKSDVESTYRIGMQIDRRDNELGYGPDNWRWATPSQQCRNQRKTVRVPWNGEQVPLADLADRFGVPKAKAYARYVLRGWPIERVLTP